MRLFLWLTPLIVCGTIMPLPASAGRFVCYFANWVVGRPDPWQFGVDQIDTELCTHLIYSFAELDENNFQIKPSDPVQDIVKKSYTKFTNLKNQNPQLKTMLAVGGWGDSIISDKYSQLVAKQENIDVFVTSVVQLLEKYGFDGLDVDWEYPRTETDKVGFINLLTSLKNAFSPYGFILSAAVPCNSFELGYDIPAMNNLLDFVNLMTYDMHGSWEPNTADHHAPLRQRSWDTIDNDVEHSVDYWIENGIVASKINLGIPLYGHTWILSSNVTTPPAPASGIGSAGPYGSEGTMSYFEICLAIQNNGWQVVQDPDMLNGPYAFSPTTAINWVGYDDIAMVIEKSNYILSKQLGGAMVWEISLDDFRGSCDNGINPLLTAISRIVLV